MATVNGLSNVNKNVVNKASVNPLQVMISSKSVQERFEKMLGDKANSFLSSLLTLVNNDKNLATANPKSILTSAAIAASLDLPVNKSLGFAWIIAYKGVAGFQIGYKGLLQLAQRSGLLRSIVCVEVYEGECQSWNKFTEEFVPGEKVSDSIVGYYASFELINGFKKTTYWTREEVLAHAKRFSKAFNSGPWKTDEKAMGKKTVLSSLLRTYAPMSIEMQNAVETDGKVATFNEETAQDEFVEVEAYDAENEDMAPTVDIETGEIVSQ